MREVWSRFAIRHRGDSGASGPLGIQKMAIAYLVNSFDHFLTFSTHDFFQLRVSVRHNPMLNSFRKTLAVILLLVVGIPSAFAQEPDSTAAPDSLLLQLQRDMAEITAASIDPISAGSTQRSRPTTNPDISLIGDVRALYFSEGDRNVDLALHEVEIAFKSVVDPYARADVYVAATNEDGEIHFELEEAYLTTLALPHQLQLKAGKFRSNIGKINRLHPHSLPYPDMPAVYTRFFGEEGLNDQGVGLSWLLPNRTFYQELSFEITRGPGESESFSTSEENRLLYTSHLKNFWDLSRNSTLELGFSGLAGPNDSGHTSWIGGVDVTYKWKPIQFNTYRSFSLQVESFFSRLETGQDDISTWGMYALASYQLAQRWAVIGRYDYTDLPDDPDWNESAISATIAWYATEFQKLELGTRSSWRDGVDADLQAIFRVVFVLGTHGAHEY